MEKQGKGRDVTNRKQFKQGQFVNLKKNIRIIIITESRLSNQQNTNIDTQNENATLHYLQDFF